MFFWDRGFHSNGARYNGANGALRRKCFFTIKEKARKYDFFAEMERYSKMWKYDRIHFLFFAKNIFVVCGIFHIGSHFGCPGAPQPGPARPMLHGQARGGRRWLVGQRICFCAKKVREFVFCFVYASPAFLIALFFDFSAFFILSSLSSPFFFACLFVLPLISWTWAMCTTIMNFSSACNPTELRNLQ